MQMFLPCSFANTDYVQTFVSVQTWQLSLFSLILTLTPQMTQDHEWPCQAGETWSLTPTSSPMSFNMSRFQLWPMRNATLPTRKILWAPMTQSSLECSVLAKQDWTPVKGTQGGLCSVETQTSEFNVELSLLETNVDLRASLEFTPGFPTTMIGLRSTDKTSTEIWILRNKSNWQNSLGSKLSLFIGMGEISLGKWMLRRDQGGLWTWVKFQSWLQH